MAITAAELKVVVDAATDKAEAGLVRVGGRAARWRREGRLKGKLMSEDRGGYRVPASELTRFMNADQSGQASNQEPITGQKTVQAVE
jgi:hypothetical protein